jgi:alginate O-acetyltransferase complex protein AlgI
MLFCTWQFCVFFAVVFTLYWLTPWARPRVYLLLAASFFFYASWNKWLALLIVVSTLLDYLIALRMEATQSPALRKLLVVTSLAANLGLLIYFKYANFFLDSLRDSAASCGLHLALPTLQVILPVGISFYTFEAINYVVDVYRAKLKAERNLANFMLFILFFPHLVAGPIVRARDFLPLAARRKRWSWLRAHTGVLLILMGLVKKLAIADRMALYATPVYDAPGAFACVALWEASLAYAIQLYCDFSGYSDMALGLAHLLGYHLARNFDMPYLSRNLSEFWRRWHISLSTWIRDYVFIPLGGSRCGRWRTYGNLLITMALAGLWHGATWGYIFFGFLQGAMLVIHSAFRTWCAGWPRLSAAMQSTAGSALRIAFTFTCFVYSLVFFRAPTLEKAWRMMGRMLTPCDGSGLTLRSRGLWLTAAFVLLCHGLAQRNLWQRLLADVPAPIRGLGFGAALTLALLLAPYASKAFIYFQF